MGPFATLGLALGSRGRGLRLLGPVVAALVVPALALTLALGFVNAAQHGAEVVRQRDGSDGSGLPRRAPTGAVVRSSRTLTSPEGPVTLTLLGGPSGARLSLPGLDRLPPLGSVMTTRAAERPRVLSALAPWLPATETHRLPDALTVGPRERVVIAVVSPSDITATGQYSVVSGLHPAGDPPSDDVRPLAALLCLAVLLPTSTLIAAIVRLTAARRTRRDATLRLLGLTPRGLRGLVVVECVVSAAFGAGVALVAVRVAEGLVDQVSLFGRSFWTRDLAVDPLQSAAVVLGTSAVAGLVGVVGTRRLSVDPLAHRTQSAGVPVRPRRVAWIAVAAAPVTVVALAPTASRITTAALLASFTLGAIGVTRAAPLVTRGLARALTPLGAAGQAGAAPLRQRPHELSRPAASIGVVAFTTIALSGLAPTLAESSPPGGAADVRVTAYRTDLTPAAERLRHTPGVRQVALSSSTVALLDGRSQVVTVIPDCAGLRMLGALPTAGRCTPGQALVPGDRPRSSGPVTLVADARAGEPDGSGLFRSWPVSGQTSTASAERLGVVVVAPTVDLAAGQLDLRTDRHPSTLSLVRDAVAATPGATMIDLPAESILARRSAATTQAQITATTSWLLALGAASTALAAWGVLIERRRALRRLRALGLTRAGAAAVGECAFLLPLLGAAVTGMAIGASLTMLAGAALGATPRWSLSTLLGGAGPSLAVVAVTVSGLALAALRVPPLPSEEA